MFIVKTFSYIAFPVLNMNIKLTEFGLNDKIDNFSFRLAFACNSSFEVNKSFEKKSQLHHSSVVTLTIIRYC